MNFIQSVKTCFKKYADFKGRATRSEFWWFQLFLIGLEILATSADYLILGYTWDDGITPLATVVDFLTVLPLAAVTARRLHDINRSGWWQLPIYMVYVFYLGVFISGFMDSVVVSIAITISGLYSLIMIFAWVRDSQPHTNRFGPNPKSEGLSDVFS